MNRHIYKHHSASHRNHRLCSDNLVLVPASQLPFKAEWKRVANSLPAREALVVIPTAETPLKHVARALVPHLHAHGRHVTAVAIN